MMATPPGELSKRMDTTVKAFMPIAAAVAARGNVKPEDINLADGENTLMKTEMVEICREAMNKNITAKTFANPVGFNGDITMKEALASYFTTYFHPTIPVTSEHIVPTTGGGNALDALLLTLCDAGDSIICPAPVWWSSSWTTDSVSYAIIPALEAAYNSAPEPKRIKALLIPNPNNPMMNCWPREVVREMMDFCQKYGLHYISDEVFANTVFDTEAEQFVSALSLLKNPEQEKENSAQTRPAAEGEKKSSIEPSLVHVVWSTTKDFGACGVRAGCVLSYHPLVRAGISFAAAWQVSSLTAIFTFALLTSPSTPSLLSSVRSQLAKNYQICHNALTSPELSGRVEILPASAGLWANAKVILKDGETTQDIVGKAKEKGVIVLPGTEFNMIKGESGWIKVTFALPEETLREGMARLKSSLL